MDTRTASCTCGELRVEVTGEPIRVSVCHCDECQRRTGSVFGVQARFPREAVQIKGQGTEFIRTNDEGAKYRFTFCSQSAGGRRRSRFFLSNTAEERVELPWIASTYLVGMNKSGNQKGNLSYLAGTKKRSDSLIELRRGSASGRMTMTLLKERGWSDDNDARAFLLSNTAEERVEALDTGIW